MTPCAITHAACIQLLFSASCFLLSASNSPLPALCTQRPVLHSCIELSASSFRLSAPCFLLSCTPLPASDFLPPALSALCSLPSVPCALSPLLSAPCLLIGTLRKMVFREVVSVGSEPELFHTPKKNACGVRPHVAPPRYLSATSLPSLHPG